MRKMTKSIRVAKDYDVKIQYRNEEWYVALEELKINGVTLRDHAEHLNNLQADFNKLSEAYSINVRNVAARLDELEKENRRLEKIIKDVIGGLISR